MSVAARLLILAGLLLSAQAQAGGVLMIDLNDSDKEVQACSDGVAANNDATGSDDDVFKLGYNSSFVKDKNGNATGKRVVDASYIDEALTQLEAQGVNVDTIVISGHDGSGHFFGKHGGSVLSSQVKTILDKHKNTKASLESMALWGCYTTNDNGCQNYWMKKVSPNIKTSIGFTLQSPDNTRPGNFRLLQDYCKKRKDINQAQTAEEITQQFNGLDNVKNWNVGICYKDGVCSTEYRRKGDKTCYHSYVELQERCSTDFDPDRSQTGIYEKYLEATEAGYKNPPSDGESDFTTSEKIISGGKTLHKKSELRAYYNQLHLWRHCAEQFKAESDSFNMPVPAQVIRLIKFDVLKKNIADLHKKDLDTYNSKLRALGLDQFALEPLDQMSRAEVVASTRGAVAALEQLAGKKATAPPAKKRVKATQEEDDETPDISGPGTNGEGLLTPLDAAPKRHSAAKRPVVPEEPEVAPSVAGSPTEAARLLRMAKGFDKTLRMLDWHCSDFSLVHEDAKVRSTCIPPY